jgi:hypothetical protein
MSQHCTGQRMEHQGRRMHDPGRGAGVDPLGLQLIAAADRLPMQSR